MADEVQVIEQKVVSWAQHVVHVVHVVKVALGAYAAIVVHAIASHFSSWL